MKESSSFYDLLGINKNASDDEIKRAYLLLAKKYHPDRNPQNRATAAKRFHKIAEAYRSIETREKRAIYNQKLRIAAENDNRRQSAGLFSRLFRPSGITTQETYK
jgi:curved DNA-binding protein CbpA